MRALAITAYALLSAAPLAAQGPLLSQAFDHFYNLELDQAIADFTAAAQENPGEASRWNHLAQAVLYRAMYRSGALESQLLTGSNPFLRRDKVETTPAEDKSFNDAIDKVIELSRPRLEHHADDGQALSALGNAYGLRANYDFLVRKAWVDALRDATKAHSTHQHLCELEPNNVDARLIPAVYDYVTGSLPLGYRMLGFLAGFHGDRGRGIQTLETVAHQGKSNRVDALVFLAAIYRRERRPKEAIPLLQELIQQFPRNYLLRFEVAQMYGDSGDRPAALQELGRIRELHLKGAPGFAQLAPEKIDYVEGNLHFWYNDLNQALEHMKKAAAKAPQLDLNTGLMSCMRLGQIYDLEGRHDAAVPAYQQAIALAPQTEIARESKGYITKPYKRQEAN